MFQINLIDLMIGSIILSTNNCTPSSLKEEDSHPAEADYHEEDALHLLRSIGSTKFDDLSNQNYY